MEKYSIVPIIISYYKFGATIDRDIKSFANQLLIPREVILLMIEVMMEHWKRFMKYNNKILKTGYELLV